MNYGKSRVPKSPHFQTILDNYKNFGSSMGHQQFFDKYIKDIDPNITVRMWRDFTKKLKVHVDKQVQNALAVYTDNKITEAKMEESSIRSVLSIAKVSLDDIIKNPEKLALIPMKDRMKWFFEAMKAQDSRTITKVKVHEESRKASLADDAIKGAQYGAVDEDAIEGEFEEIPEEAPEEEPKKEKKEPKTVEFDPKDL